MWRYQIVRSHHQVGTFAAVKVQVIHMALQIITQHTNIWMSGGDRTGRGLVTSAACAFMSMLGLKPRLSIRIAVSNLVRTALKYLELFQVPEILEGMGNGIVRGKRRGIETERLDRK